MLIALALALQNIAPSPPLQPIGYAQIRVMPVPVISGDISDRPYRVVGNIETNVRKLTIFEKDPPEAKVYRELWERARKLGADAVVNAKYSGTLYGGWTWGRRHATGQAIKFLTDEEIRRKVGMSDGKLWSRVESRYGDNECKTLEAEHVCLAFGDDRRLAGLGPDRRGALHS